MKRIAVIGLAVALSREVPAVALILLITVVPAMIITEVVDYRRRRRGRPMYREEKLAWILALSVQIPALLTLALAVAFGLYSMIR
jgi:hypothetical protein